MSQPLHYDKLDTSDPGKAANVVARAAILFAQVCGYNAENSIRISRQEALAFDYNCFDGAIEDAFPELL